MDQVKKRFTLPHVYIMFMLVMVFVVILSWVVPAGEFERVVDEAGKTVVNPDNFTYLEERDAIGFLDFFAAMHQGVVNAAHIIVLLLFACGSIHMLDESGAIRAGINVLLKNSAGKETLIMVLLGLSFATMGTIGFAEGMIPLIPIVTSVVMGMGYDRITGLSLGVLSSAIGFTSGAVNLYTTGVSQEILGIPLFSGLWFRLVSFAVFFVVAIFFVLRYGKKVKRDPSKSIVAEEYKLQLQGTAEDQVLDDQPFTMAHKLAILGLIGTVVFTAVGAAYYGFGLPILSGIYVVYAIYLTIVLKINPNQAAVQFGVGAAALLPAALAIGFASGVMVLMTQAKIVDTAVYALSNFLQGKGDILTLLMIFLSVAIFNFFVVSGSGKALILMPILGPLAQILSINPQIMVLVYQFGDGLTNYMWPTAGVLMAILTMNQVEFGDWFKFAWKPILILHIVGFLLILLASAIGLT